MSDKRSVSEKPQPGSLEFTEELIRWRAYQLYEQRGWEEGHELDDWLQAEAEISGKKPGESAPVAKRKANSATAA